MNTISYNGESFDFTTPDELLATPLVRNVTDDPAFTHLGYADTWLMACDSRPVWRVVGRLKERVVLPGVLHVGAAA